jgi:hypothetical protein
VRADDICSLARSTLHHHASTRLKYGVIQARLEDVFLYPEPSSISQQKRIDLGPRYVLELGTVVREPGNIRVEYAAINQLLYIHCTCRIDDIFAHQGLVRKKRSIVEYYTSSIEGSAESQRIEEVCNCGGHVRTVHEFLLKHRPGLFRMRYQADGWGPRKREQGINDKLIGAGGGRDDYNGHGLLRRVPEMLAGTTL